MHTSREILENIISNYLGAEIMDDFFSSYLSFLPAPQLYFFIMSIVKQFGLEN